MTSTYQETDADLFREVDRLNREIEAVLKPLQQAKEEAAGKIVRSRLQHLFAENPTLETIEWDQHSQEYDDDNEAYEVNIGAEGLLLNGQRRYDITEWVNTIGDRYGGRMRTLPGQEDFYDLFEVVSEELNGIGEFVLKDFFGDVDYVRVTPTGITISG